MIWLQRAVATGCGALAGWMFPIEPLTGIVWFLSGIAVIVIAERG